MNAQPTDEIEAVRERIARVEYEFHHPPDKELAWDRIKDEARFAPLVAVYYGRADAVLDALGLEQVGWFVRFPSGIEAIGLAPFENDSDMGRQEPVYRASFSGSREATDGS